MVAWEKITRQNSRTLTGGDDDGCVSPTSSSPPLPGLKFSRYTNFRCNVPTSHPEKRLQKADRQMKTSRVGVWEAHTMILAHCGKVEVVVKCTDFKLLYKSTVVSSRRIDFKLVGNRGDSRMWPPWCHQSTAQVGPSTFHCSLYCTHIKWETQTVQKVHNIDMMFMQEEVVVMHKNQVGK